MLRQLHLQWHPDKHMQNSESEQAWAKEQYELIKRHAEWMQRDKYGMNPLLKSDQSNQFEGFSEDAAKFTAQNSPFRDDSKSPLGSMK